MRCLGCRCDSFILDVYSSDEGKRFDTVQLP
jgi:hypothetical protein